MLALALISSVWCFANYDRDTLCDTHFFEGAEKRGLILYADNGSGDLISYRHRFLSRKTIFTATNEQGDTLAKATLVKSDPLEIKVDAQSEWIIREEVNPQTQEHYLSIKNSQNEEKAIGIRTSSQKHYGYTFYNSDRDRVALLLRSTLHRNKEGDSWTLTLDSTEVPRAVFLSLAAFETRSSYIRFAVNRAKKIGIVSALALAGGYGYYKYRTSQKTEISPVTQVQKQPEAVELQDFREPPVTLNDLKKCQTDLREEIKTNDNALLSAINTNRKELEALKHHHVALSEFASKSVATTSNLFKAHQEEYQLQFSNIAKEISGMKKATHLLQEQSGVFQTIIDTVLK